MPITATAVRPAISRMVELHPKKAARYLARLERTIEAGRIDDVERARLDGQRAEFVEALRSSKHCRRCGADLTDPDSVVAGVGPDCRERLERRAS